jgi:hypothetical protein
VTFRNQKTKNIKTDKKASIPTFPSIPLNKTIGKTSLFNKPIKLKIAIPAIATSIAIAVILTLIITTTALGAPIIKFPWQQTLTGHTPPITFIKPDGTTATTISIPENIYASIDTIDQNTTYGIKNIDTTTKQFTLNIANITGASNIQAITISIMNATNPYTPSNPQNVTSIHWKTGDTLPATSSTITINPSITVWIAVTVTGSPTVTQGATVTVNLELITQL